MPLGLLKYALSPRYPAKPDLRPTPDLKPSYDVVIIGGGGHATGIDRRDEDVERAQIDNRLLHQG